MSRNKYLKIYCQIVRRAMSQRSLELVEKHHIFPISIFGKNKSIVKLTPREHFLAHWLLWKGFKKRYGKNYKKTRSAAYAFGMMARFKKYNKKGSKAYEIGKKALLEAVTGRPSWCRGLTKYTDPRLALLGKKVSRSLKGKFKGSKNSMFGKHHTQEVKDAQAKRAIEIFKNLLPNS